MKSQPQKSQSSYLNTDSIVDAYEDEHSLATFTISYGYDEEQSNNKTHGKWIQPNELITIKGKNIKGGYFYLGGVLSAYSSDNTYSRHFTEASLIDDTLAINNKPYLFQDESLGYWNRFITLSPDTRGAYIDWLAGERNQPDTPIGYVFIYFYGLERRVLVDAKTNKVNDSEYLALFSEIQRLKSIYGEHRSFYYYSSKLLELMCLFKPNLVTLADSDLLIENDSLLFKYRLASKVAAGKPISADLALLWVKYFPEFSLRTPARRCSSEFAQLFKEKYIKSCGEGIIVKPNKTKLRLDYHPASSTLRGIAINQQDLPDPSLLKTPVKKLITIAESCTDELDAYSRYLGRKDSSREDLAALLLLPDTLINVDNSNILAKFKEWADKSIINNNGLISVEEFWKHTSMPLPCKINKKETELMLNLATKAGYGMAPDFRFHHAKPELDGKLVLFLNGYGDFFESSITFNEVGMILRLGAMIALSDSYLDESELRLLKQLIDHNEKLSPVEKRSLHAYLLWQLNTPINITGLKARVEKLSIEQKKGISRLLINIAMADGNVSTVEIKKLEQLYTALGLDKSSVTSDIHNNTSLLKGVSSSTTNNPATLQGSSSEFMLDRAMLAIHESETKEVKNILSSIFIDEGVLEEVIDNTKEVKVGNTSELDTSHQLFKKLLEKNRWSRSEVEKLCQELKLMIDGAIETINDWAFDKIDAPVLDNDGDIYIDQESVNELEGLKG